MVSGNDTYYFYSGAQVISEKRGSEWTDYVFFGGQRIAKHTGWTGSVVTAHRLLPAAARWCREEWRASGAARSHGNLFISGI